MNEIVYIQETTKKTEILKVECGECSMVFCIDFEMVFIVYEMRACYE